MRNNKCSCLSFVLAWKTGITSCCRLYQTMLLIVTIVRITRILYSRQSGLKRSTKLPFRLFLHRSRIDSSCIFNRKYIFNKYRRKITKFKKKFKKKKIELRGIDERKLTKSLLCDLLSKILGFGIFENIEFTRNFESAFIISRVFFFFFLEKEDTTYPILTLRINNSSDPWWRTEIRSIRTIYPKLA